MNCGFCETCGPDSDPTQTSVHLRLNFPTLMRSARSWALILALWLCAASVSNALFFYIYKGVRRHALRLLSVWLFRQLTNADAVCHRTTAASWSTCRRRRRSAPSMSLQIPQTPWYDALNNACQRMLLSAAAADSAVLCIENGAVHLRAKLRARPGERAHQEGSH